jgi:hypothetical protein
VRIYASYGLFQRVVPTRRSNEKETDMKGAKTKKELSPKQREETAHNIESPF